MIISIKNTSGKIFKINVLNTHTILDLKKKIEIDTTINTKQLRLISSGKMLADNNTIKYYDIKSGDVIQLVLYMFGG